MRRGSATERGSGRPWRREGKCVVKGKEPKRWKNSGRREPGGEGQK